MKQRWQIRCVAWACCISSLFLQPVRSAETESEQFLAILELAQIGPEVLANLGSGPDYSEDDWQLLMQVFHRLQQFRASDSAAPDAAAVSVGKRARLGEMVRLAGTVVSVAKLPLPAKFAELHDQKFVYRCQLRFMDRAGEESGRADLLATHIPNRWKTKKKFDEGVNVRGTIVQFSEETGQPLILTNHIAWYPDKGVPTGQILLARHGMDVALLDEVLHRQPFVRPEIRREGEAFYAALIALGKTDSSELLGAAKENVVRVTQKWRSLQPKLQRKHLQLEAKITTVTDPSERKSLQQQMKLAKNQRGLAATVVKLGDAGRSSVAPMFLQPEEEIGELFFLEGIARRAVRITATEQREIEAYYELDLFTTDSQNLPIVCCVCQLPANFPTGDEIREPVQITGLFFKTWRYRSRKLVGQPGETSQQRQRYTPVLLGHSPIWLNKATRSNSRLALWGGIAFLGFLVTLWISLSWVARRDRRARISLRRTEIDVQKL